MLYPTAHGPCREGTYNLLTQITLERLGWSDRVRIWPPSDSGYFNDLPGGLSMLIFTAFITSDLLLAGLHEVQPVETRPGAAQEIYRRQLARLLRTLEQAATTLSSLDAAWQYASGQLFGLRQLLAEASAEFAAIRGPQEIPTVLVVGEIYVRCDPFANDFVIERLQRRGIRARLAPFHEWLDYSDFILRRNELGGLSLSGRISGHVRRQIQHSLHGSTCACLDRAEPPGIGEVLDAAEPFLRSKLIGEAVLTVGTPLEEWRRREIDAVVSVGPLECMPNKISEAQFFHVAEREGLLSLTLPLNGDRLDEEVLDNFAFDVRARFHRHRQFPEKTPSSSPAMGKTSG